MKKTYIINKRKKKIYPQNNDQKKTDYKNSRQIKIFKLLPTNSCIIMYIPLLFYIFHNVTS